MKSTIASITQEMIALCDLSNKRPLTPKESAKLASLSQEYGNYHMGEKNKKDMEWLDFMDSRQGR